MGMLYNATLPCENTGVRPALLCSLVLVVLASGTDYVRAQGRLTDILNPPPDKKSVYQNQTFSMPSKYGTKSSSESGKSYYFVDKNSKSKSFSTGTYSGTKNYEATKTSSFADKKADTKNAVGISAKSAQGADRKYATDTVTEKSAHDADRTVDTKSYSDVGKFKVPGKAQGSLDRQSAAQSGLSEEEVKKLLNRSK